MEGDKKWFTACLTLLGLAVLSFSTCSDVSAYKYAYDNIPLIPNHYIAGDIQNTTGGYAISDGSFYIGVSNLPNDWAVPSGYEAQLFNYSTLNQQCSETNSPLLYAGSYGVLSGNALSDVYRYLNVSYNPVSDAVFCHNKLEPTLSAWYIGKYNATDGSFIGSSAVPFSNLIQNTDSSLTFTDFTIPMTIKQDEYFGGFPQSTKARFVIEYYSTTDFDFLNTPTGELKLSYLAQPYDYDSNLTNQQLFDFFVTTTITPIRYNVIPPTDSFHYYTLRIYADYTFPTDATFISPTMSFYNSSGLFSKTADDLYFGGMWLVTNDDYTWTNQYINDTIWGSSTVINNNGNGVNCSNGDFFCQLGYLFDFNLINPFTPLFSMFTDNSACVNIPTVASMIHSNETQVCPWFDSTTRGIVTPVLGIASVMLLFGFAVRWLGARSGNFFEDSTDGFDSGGVHIGRRKR